MSSQGKRTRGMRAHEKQGLGTQVGSSSSRVHSPEPVTEPKPMGDRVENTHSTKEDHKELVDDVVSHAMLRVLLRVVGAQNGSGNRGTIAKRLHTN